MATFINSSPSLSGGTLPTNAGELIRGEEWGIDNILSGFIIQSEDISDIEMIETNEAYGGAENTIPCLMDF